MRISALLFLLFLMLCFTALCLGAIHIAPADVAGAVSGAIFGNASGTSEEELILFSVRLPRILFAGIVGASLSLGGVVFQALLRNPLADPYVLGISGGSALGAIVGIVVGAASFYLGVPFLAFCGALATVFLVFIVAGGSRGVLLDNSLLLAGVVVNAFFSAAILFALSVVNSMELHSISFWLMGDLSRASLKEIFGTALCFAACFVLLYTQARKLNLIVQGEETALQLGVNVLATKYLLLIVTSLITAIAVSFAGIIGFIGIMVPHMMRLVFGSDHRLLIPASALFGASFLVVADTLARTVLSPAELPVGVITALCGAPYFIFLMRRKGRG
ncbi:MAG: iron ABC transporter permease [Deltaproteobacteria bacterium HGW-Deltaproteobacteria-9]|nr:MAG: iron ABC transporter permease [Deltaproteobacteria bacterium HGW-Deltaproteobacteria-9]